jgi:hypothetical protein
VAPRPSMADPFVPFIVEQLEKYPRLRASRLYEMVKARGYPGGSDHFRRVVGRHRPRKAAEAFQRLKTLPGEQAQVDWAHFGKLRVGQAERPLWAFVMVLSYSRRLFLRFFAGASMPYFLRGHVDALLDAVGPGELEEALVEALERDAVHVGAVRQITDRRRSERGLPPPVSIPVARGEHGDLVVTPHALSTYDALKKEHDA